MDLKGLGVAMVTPFDVNGEVDYPSLELLTEDLITGGVDFLVVIGTTGEAATLDRSEKSKILETVIKKCQNRVPIVYGIGGNNTKAVCAELESFTVQGVTAILSASPSYNKPTQEGIFRHYQAINNSTPLPVILYNVPGRTASNVEASTCIRIARELPMIKAVKEASGNMEQIKKIISSTPQDFLTFSGDDALTIPVMEAGGVGVISVIGNALPSTFSEMVTKASESIDSEVRTMDENFQEIIPLLFKEGNPAGVKALMQLNHKCTDYVRLPLVSASHGLKLELKAAASKVLEMA